MRQLQHDVVEQWLRIQHFLNRLELPDGTFRLTNVDAVAHDSAVAASQWRFHTHPGLQQVPEVVRNAVRVRLLQRQVEDHFGHLNVFRGGLFPFRLVGEFEVCLLIGHERWLLVKNRLRWSSSGGVVNSDTVTMAMDDTTIIAVTGISS